MLKTLWRTLLLVMLGALVLAAMAAYVKLTQHQPVENDPLRISVVRDVIWPWQEAELWLDYSGEKGELAPDKKSPLSLLFLLDTSGSMTDDDVRRAKQEIIEFPLNLGNDSSDVEVAVIEFASSARVVTPFTADMRQLAGILESMERNVGVGTQFLAGLSEALTLMSNQGPTTVVMLTDGAAYESNESLRNFYEQQWKPTGNELYMIGIGDMGVLTDSFVALTDDPSRYMIFGQDRGVIPLLFNETALRIVNSGGRYARIELPLAEPLWEWGREAIALGDLATERRRLLPMSTRSDTFAIPILFNRTYRWRMNIEHKIGGILTTLRRPPTLDYVELSGEVYSVQSKSSLMPKVLVISWMMLLLLLLPALLVLFLAFLDWFFRRTPEVVDLNPVPLRKVRRPPPDLPLRSPIAAERIDWSPTLIIGLGKSGREVLSHVQQNIDDSFDTPETRPLLLALDVARDELEADNTERFPGCLGKLSPKQIFMLPPESCALHESVHSIRDSEDPAAVLDLAPYEGMGADALRLTSGTSGEAPLARLALLNDLSAGSESALLKRLVDAMDEWRQIDSKVRSRQILLVAHAKGGVGSGWLTDLLILLRRMVAPNVAQGQSIEINLLLLGDEQPVYDQGLPLDAPILFREFDRLAASGQRPFRHRLANIAGTAEVLLDGDVSARPQDNIFVMLRPASDPQGDYYPAAADAVTLLIDQRRRTGLTYQLQAIKGAEAKRRVVEGRELFTQIAIHNAVFPRSFFATLLHRRLLNLLGGNQVLFSERNRDGVLQMQPIPLEELFSGHAVEDLTNSADAALFKAVSGDCEQLRKTALGTGSLSLECNRLRLDLIETVNSKLHVRELGLAGLADAAKKLGANFDLCTGQLGGSESLSGLTDICNSIQEQALAWIELFFGSQVLKTLEYEAVFSNINGLINQCASDYSDVVESLAEWSRSPSRTLVSPIPGSDIENRKKLDEELDTLLLRFIQNWLGIKSDLNVGLENRCYWELISPGANGRPIAINLVLRGSRVRRYKSTQQDISRFERDLYTEIRLLLDDNPDFHILAMLQQEISNNEDGEEAALIDFSSKLKGELRGDYSALMATIPELQQFQFGKLLAFREQLIQTLQTLTVNAAESVDIVNVKDRNRISVLQTLPLLVPDQPGAMVGSPVHGPEARLKRYAEELANVSGRAEVQLPAAAGIALEDRERLCHFAGLYANGQIVRRENDKLWYIHDKDSLIRLTSMPAQSLADAAAYFVTRTTVDIAIDAGNHTTLEQHHNGDDFVTLLNWLLES